MSEYTKQHRQHVPDLNSQGIAFGPVPSRRLGRSLGINNIPPKVCSYSCVYCQVGKTSSKRISRQAFYSPEAVLSEVEKKVEKAKALGEAVDFLSFVPGGEPTLDENLAREIALMRPLGARIAVISNASLIWREDVRNDLARADWVSLKIDSVADNIWKRINRPCPDLNLSKILEAILVFQKEFTGELVTETMLVQGINDRDDDIEDLAKFLGRLQPAKAYLSIPTRPPASSWVQPPTTDFLDKACRVVGKAVEKVEVLSGDAGSTFSLTGDAEEELIKIIAVHPMPREAVEEFLSKAGGDWTLINTMLAQGRLSEAMYGGRKFYVRKDIRYYYPFDNKET